MGLGVHEQSYLRDSIKSVDIKRLGFVPLRQQLNMSLQDKIFCRLVLNESAAQHGCGIELPLLGFVNNSAPAYKERHFTDFLLP